MASPGYMEYYYVERNQNSSNGWLELKTQLGKECHIFFRRRVSNHWEKSDQLGASFGCMYSTSTCYSNSSSAYTYNTQHTQTKMHKSNSSSSSLPLYTIIFAALSTILPIPGILACIKDQYHPLHLWQTWPLGPLFRRGEEEGVCGWSWGPP